MTVRRNRFLLSTFVLVILISVGCSIPVLGPVEKTLYIAPYMVECEGEGPQMCLLVKENPEDEYTYFYDQIEGFDYQEGFEYVIKVSEETVDNPPAGGSSIRWELVEVVSRVEAGGAQSLILLESNLWLLVMYRSADGDLVEILQGTEITAEFKSNQITGNAGCNNYFASYTLEGNQISIRDIGMTEMYCADPEGVMDQEMAFLNALGNASIIQADDRSLTILGLSGEELLVFSKSEPLTLVGTQWRLDFYNDGEGAFVSVLNGTQIDALFDELGNVSGSGGCNQYTAQYQLDGNRLEISSAASTMMFCAEPEGAMDQELAYLSALESATAYQIDGNMLTMENAEGVRVLSFTAERGEMVQATLPPQETTATIESSAAPDLSTVEASATSMGTVTPSPSPTPQLTATEKASATPLPSPTPSAISLANPIFEDDFESDTGWTEYQVEGHGFKRTQGGYQIYSNTANGFIWSVRSLDPANVTLEASAVLLSGSEQGYYGLVCRFNGGVDYYVMVINASGFYGIGRVQAGQLEFLEDGIDQEGIILRGNRSNLLRGDCVGDTLSLFVNGQKMLETSDDMFSEGNIGLVVLSTYRNPQIQVLFDDFKVYER